MADPVYWIGQDSNIYYGSGQQGAPVLNLGSATDGQYLVKSDGLYDKFTDSGVPSLTFSATQISDPAVKTAAAPAPTQTTTSTYKPLNTAAINNTNATIGQLPALLQAALDAENQRYSNTENDFNAQEQQQRGTYDTSTTTNQQNYDANYMDSIRAGIKGLGGLMALLRGTGAAGGTVDDQVRDTVGGVTAQDIRGGADTQKENQSALDASLGSFLTSLKTKRDTNRDTRTNNERAIRRDSNTQLQDLYGKMAGYYSEAGNTAEYNNWMAKAGALTPEIATNSRTQVSPYDTTPVAVQAPQITAFAGPTQPNVLAAPSNGQVGSGIFTMTDRRRNREPAVAGA